MGFVDSSVDQSEHLELLARIERQLYVHSTTDNRIIKSASATSSSVNVWSPLSAELFHNLWTLVLDVVFAPLWLRIHAAELLCVYCDTESESDQLVKLHTQETHKLRAIVSSTCQALEELNAMDTIQADQLFTWFGFLERVLLATKSDVCSQVFQNSMYTGMLIKMLRLLSACSTKVFAATTICLGLFHSHEKACGHSVLVRQVLREMKEGREHLSGALLHVINSCGCPCPTERTIHLWNTLQLFGDILADETASELVFPNDYKVLIDLIIRESTDLPQDDMTRFYFMKLLQRVLDSSLYFQVKLYRNRDLLELLESLLKAGVTQESTMPRDVVEIIKQILVTHIDLLD
ncbi:unnamed protein product [Peronospora farinosa]|uniref:SPIN90/Ldb17 leucine-rich domain-containing protein n=1 Tax=Peronospora farinosa TaxID=134698 RepID=A0AAV0UW98_9STRA|nr:unnamed protein product [Peronospora farinosa]CAI5741232.1 unnamed protein product [Peronospora farinosa]